MMKAHDGRSWSVSGLGVAMGAAFAVVSLLIGGVWALTVALSPVKGAGDVIKKQHDADTIINAHAELLERFNGIQALDIQVGIAASAAADPDADKIDKTNYAGVLAACNTAVAEYNAATQKILNRNQLGDLPEQINTNDPSTDCK